MPCLIYLICRQMPISFKIDTVVPILSKKVLIISDFYLHSPGHLDVYRMLILKDSFVSEIIS